MTRNLLASLLLIFSIACSMPDKEGFYRSEDNLRYDFIEDHDGNSPKVGDVMILQMSYETEDDSLLFNSTEVADSYLVVLVEPTFTGGVEAGFAMMSPGDSARFRVSADSVFERTFGGFVPPYIRSGSELEFRVRMIGYYEQAVYDSIEKARDLQYRENEFLLIEEFMKVNGIDPAPTESGLYIDTKETGDGILPEIGDSIEVEFIGRLMDGTIFDASDFENEPFIIVLGKNEVMPGWEEGISTMSKGEKARLIIPSDLAFGDRYVGEVPPYSTLVYDIEIIDIRKGTGEGQPDSD